VLVPGFEPMILVLRVKFSATLLLAQLSYYTYCQFLPPVASGMFQTHDFRVIIQLIYHCAGTQPTYNP